MGKFNDRYRALKASYRTDLSTPENRRRALIYQAWFDHGALRALWSNMYEIAPQVWRSNHPTPKRFDRMADMGIKTIISLRGKGQSPWALLEEEACTRVGITFEAVALQSRSAPRKEELQKLLALFKSVQKPMLMHCKSGADRAGLASVLYLLVIEGKPLEEARKMLSLRYLHLSNSKTGVLDLLLDTYAASGEPDFEAWLDRDYDADTLQATFDARQK